MVTVPVLEPFWVGSKVTLMVHELSAAKVASHVLVCAKSPLAAILLIVSTALPGLNNVTVCGLLVVPTT
jgi:hypothetical protein